MKVRLEDIPDEGLDVAFELKTAAAEDLGEVVKAVIDAPKAKLHLNKSGEFVLARGSASAMLRVDCSRCLKSFDMTVDQGLDLVFQPLVKYDDEVELISSDMEVSFYEGEEVDLGQAVLDEIGLAIPMAPLCRPECVGICPHCGQDLRKGRCQCGTKEFDPRWAKLAELKKQTD